MRALRTIGPVFSSAVFLPLCLNAQAGHGRDLRVESDLVLVPVTVSDGYNHPIKGLTKDSFRVFDDGVEQTITHFSMDDAPLAIGMVFDNSASMRFRLDRARMAAAAFFRIANPEDEYFLVQFNNSARLTVPLTQDLDQLERRITQARPVGHTALLDAIYLALNEMKHSHLRRKALLVVSDGGDNASRYTEREVERVLRESDVVIYSIGIFAPFNRRRPIEELNGPGLLRKISERSGGRLIPVIDTIQLPYMAVKLGIEMRNRYILGYAPGNIRDDGHYHRVQVKLTAPPGQPLYATWRDGYYAPAR